MSRIVRQSHIDGFVSGLRDMNPLAHEEQSTRTLEEGLDEFLKASIEKKERRRRNSYNVPGTPASKRVTNRIMGERGD